MTDFILKPGTRISHYDVQSRIGAGGMGEVFRATDTTLDRSVALKILPPKLLSDAERVRRFVLEAKSASALNHPNIVTIYEIGQAPVTDDAGQAHTLHYMSMEFIEGQTLRAMISRGTSLEDLLGILAQVADGLAKAHAAGIVHRDLKPDNIMVTDDGFAKIVDFGLAKLTEQKQPSGEGQLTQSGVVLGTIGYMSPEQVSGDVIQPASDIFSFGCILYECVTRKRPFQADLAIDTLHKIMFSEPMPVMALNAMAPPQLQTIIDRCLRKRPPERYATMREVGALLREITGSRRPSSNPAIPVLDSPTVALTPPPGTPPPGSGPRIQAVPFSEASAPRTARRAGGRGAGAIFSIALKALVVAAAAVGLWIFATMPPVADLKETNPTTLASGELKAWTDYDKIAPPLRRAAVAAIDSTFYKRRAVTSNNAVEAVRSMITPERELYAPSPIAVATARALYVKGPNPFNPIRAWVIGMSLTSALPKQRILELYLNVAPFGEATGVSDAAQHYFHKPLPKLSRDQAALIAASGANRSADPSNPSADLNATKASVIGKMPEGDDE